MAKRNSPHIEVRFDTATARYVAWYPDNEDIPVAVGYSRHDAERNARSLAREFA